MKTNRHYEGTALVTGASQRIGEALALKLSFLNYRIALHYNHSKKQAETLRQVIKDSGRACEIFRCDLASPQESAKLVGQVFQRFGDLNVLVNNASVFKPSRFKTATIQSFDEHFNVHVKTPFILMQDFVKRCHKGQIINILDTNITKNKTHHFTYLLSKKALYELTKMAAVEAGPHVRVNAIAPGLILPPKGKDSAYLQKRAASVPLQRTGDIEKIVQSMEFLLTNTYLTGQVLFNDGGEHLI